MKKILSILAATTLSLSGYAQGFYLNLGFGYNMPQAGQMMYDTPNPYNGFPTGYNGSRSNTASTQTYNIKSASFAAGVTGSAGVGYMINRNVGLQLDAVLGLATKKYTFTDENVSLQTTAGSIQENILTSQQAKNPLLMVPSLVLRSGREPLDLYARFGVVLPLASKVTQTETFENSPGTGALTVDNFTWEIKNSFSLGFAAAAGVNYKLNDNISIWGELNLVSLTLNAKQQDLISWTEDGQNVPLSNYSNQQHIKFSKTATLDSSFAQLPAYSQPFSSIGVHVGVTFNLSKNRHSNAGRYEEGETGRPYRRR